MAPSLTTLGGSVTNRNEQVSLSCVDQICFGHLLRSAAGSNGSSICRVLRNSDIDFHSVCIC